MKKYGSDDIMKKILVQTYDTAFQNSAGGVKNRILRTVEVLKKNGIQVDFFDKFHTKVEDYDVLHVFMLKEESYSLIKYAKAKGLKVVVSSIVILSGKLQLRLYWWIRRLPIMTTYKLLFNICDLADVIIVETPKEAVFLQKYYHVSNEKIKIIPNGADRPNNGNDSIYSEIGRKCNYALQVGRFDANKNQLNVIKAMKHTGIEVVFIGGASPAEPEYYEKCIQEARGADNFHFLGWLSTESELFQSAYSNAKVIISSSYHETFGLTILEGIMAGANPVVSNTLPILEYDVLKKGCLSFNPYNVYEIRNTIKQAMTNRNSKFIENELSSKVESFFSWDNVAKEHIDAYGIEIK